VEKDMLFILHIISIAKDTGTT